MMRKFKAPDPEDNEEDEDDELEKKKEEEEYIRLEPEGALAGEHEIVQLEIPERDEVKARRQQPDAEQLYEDQKPVEEEMEDEWGDVTDDAPPLPWGWFALVGFILVGGVVWSLVNVHLADSHLEAIRLESGVLLDVEETSIKAAESLMERIEQSLHAYAIATDVESRLLVVRQPDRVRKLMEDHYSRHEFTTNIKPKIESLHPLTLATYGNYWIAMLSFEDGSRANWIVEADEDGPALVDWETAVCYQPMDWDDYALIRPEGMSMDFRVYLDAGALFSHEFQDSSIWDCYRLTSLESEEILFGYVQANSPSANLLREWFRRNPESHNASMILRLSIPSGLQSPRGVVIEEVRAVRWIYVVPPDGDS